MGAGGKLSLKSQLAAAVNAHGRKGGNGAAPCAVAVFGDGDADGFRHGNLAAVIGVIRRPAGALLPVNLLGGQGQLVAGSNQRTVDGAVGSADQHIGSGPLYRIAVLVRPVLILPVVAVQALAHHTARFGTLGVLHNIPLPAVQLLPGLGAAGLGADQRVGQSGAIGLQILHIRNGDFKIVDVLWHIDLVAAVGAGVAVIRAEISGCCAS